MDFTFAFPTLRDIATLALVRSIVKLDDKISRINHFYSSEYKKLVLERALPSKIKFHVLEALKGTVDHVSEWAKCDRYVYSTNYSTPELQFDVYGNVDELKMVRKFLDSCHQNASYDTDLDALSELLKMACFYALFADIAILLQKMLKLLARGAIPQLLPPEFENTELQYLSLKYTFANEEKMSPWFRIAPFRSNDKNSFVFIGYHGVTIVLKRCYYNSTLLQIHFDLVPSANRMKFVAELLNEASVNKYFDQVMTILNFADAATRNYYFTQLSSDLSTKAFDFLQCLLVWPFQEFFLDSFELVKSGLYMSDCCKLFVVIVSKLDMKSFEGILVPFWNGLPPGAKMYIRSLIADDRNTLLEELKDALVELSGYNASLYKQVVELLLEPNEM